VTPGITHWSGWRGHLFSYLHAAWQANVVELVPEHVHRALAYIRLLNDRGIDPEWEHVEAFASTEVPKGVGYEEYSPVFGRASIGLWVVQQRKVRDADPVLAYLEAMGWIAASENSDCRVHLTNVGRVLLEGLEAEAPLEVPDSSVADVVLEPTDPLAWVSLTRVVANARAGLLVDAYFKAEYLPWLIEGTSMRRVLVSSRHPKASQDLTAMAVALATVPNADQVEVRSTNSAELHDRCIIGADGNLKLLGSSINGVGRNLTAVITPDPEAMRVYRDRYEKLWASAVVITPQLPGVVSSSDEGSM